MSTTVNIAPINSAYQYYQNTSFTSQGNGSIAQAGDAGTNNYTWPIGFDLSAYANKRLVSLTLYAYLLDASSNTFTSGEYIGVGLSANYTPYSAVSGANRTDLSNSHIMGSSGDQWNSWDVSAAWDTLKGGTAYLVLYGNEYAGFNTNDSDVAANKRVYLELVYNEPIQVDIDGGSTWKYGTNLQVNIDEGGNNFKNVTKLQVYDGANWKTAF